MFSKVIQTALFLSIFLCFGIIQVHSQALDIVNAATSSTQNAAGDTLVHVENDGNVGIGTTSPAEKLDVAGNIKSKGTIDAIGMSSKIRFHYNDLWDLPPASTYHGMFAHVHTQGTAYFSHAGQWLRIIHEDFSGNVGIGTTNPSGILHVDGGTAALDEVATDITLQAQNGGTSSACNPYCEGGNILLLPGEGAFKGHVGIGTTSPAEMLDVAGNIKASGTIQSGASITIDGTTDTITATGGTISFNDENLTTTGTTTTNALTISGLDCSENANGGALTVNANGVVSCSDDDTGGGGGASILSGHVQIVAPGTTLYGGYGHEGSTTEANRHFAATRSGTLKNFFVVIPYVIAHGSSIIASVRVNGVTTALTVTFTSNSSTKLSDTVNTIAVNQGDFISVEWITSNTDPKVGQVPIFTTATFELE